MALRRKRTADYTLRSFERSVCKLNGLAQDPPGDALRREVAIEERHGIAGNPGHALLILE